MVIPCKWLDNVDLHTYAKFDQNLPCGFESYELYPFRPWADGQKDGLTDSCSDYSAHTPAGRLIYKQLYTNI